MKRSGMKMIFIHGAFEFPALPAPLIRIDTDESSPDESARKIQNAIELDG